MSISAYPINEATTKIVTAYDNEDYIADKVCPFTGPVDSMLFNWHEFPIGDTITPEDDTVGHRSDLNEVDLGGTKQTSSIEDHGLKGQVPYAEVKSAADPQKIVQRQSLVLRGKIALNREIRVANKVFNPDNYAAANVLAIGSDADRISDPKSNALALIRDHAADMLVNANTLTLNSKVWEFLLKNESIQKAVFGKVGQMPSIEQVAQALGLKTINIAKANMRVNNAKGSLNVGKVWGDHLGLSYQEAITNKDTFTHMATVPFETKDGIIAGDKFDPEAGARGAYKYRVVQSVQEIVIAPEAGALITDVIV